MLDFIKQLFGKQDRELTFVLFDEQEPEPSNSYQFRPAKLLYLFYGALLAVFLLAFLIFKFTPVGELLFSQASGELRTQAIEISKRVEALQDSLKARDLQLAQMKKVIITGEDTSFSTVDARRETSSRTGPDSLEPIPPSGVTEDAHALLTKNELVLYDLFRDEPLFPTDFPLEGTLTRRFNPEAGHFGIDIATSEGIPFKAIADGAVINQSWTLNYGWVLQVQHTNGLITIYKHAEDLFKSVGDIVLKGDILGTAGDIGIMSSGPHLHLEIWKNGVPQNPKLYLIKS